MDHIYMAKIALRSSETYIENSGELQNHSPTKKNMNLILLMVQKSGIHQLKDRYLKSHYITKV